MSTPTPTHTAVQRDEILSRIRVAMSKHGLQSRTLADEIADAVLASPPALAVPNVQATAPERIYLVIGEDCPADADFGDLADVSWWHEKIDANSIEYVRADLVSATLQPECGSLQDLGDAADLVTKLGQAETKGEMLALVLRYRRQIREQAASQVERGES